MDNKNHRENSRKKALREGKSYEQWKYEWSSRMYGFIDPGVIHTFKPYKPKVKKATIKLNDLDYGIEEEPIIGHIARDGGPLDFGIPDAEPDTADGDHRMTF